ncbi:MAG TPA: L-serine ammonia-lyase, iron-sulfur-dependent subunit beta [Gemmatimonadales bacterium]|nr:L-serine ammonia-lyase, iron-sulfur-dependent subunit beta [Gemmatimonadales bacterium]
MISLLDIIGPVMVGPSSSHTAGACRIGLFARALLGGPPESALIELHGSFARTGQGHGTDRALVGGLLGYRPDDERLRDSLELAAAAGMTVSFQNTKLRGDHHPNTARLTLGRGDRQVTLIGSSIGAGRIVITRIDDYPVEITGTLPTLVVVASDQPGAVAAITTTLAAQGGNIATIKVSRREKGGHAIHIYELDEPVGAEALAALLALPRVQSVRAIGRVDG